MFERFPFFPPPTFPHLGFPVFFFPCFLPSRQSCSDLVDRDESPVGQIFPRVGQPPFHLLRFPVRFCQLSAHFCTFFGLLYSGPPFSLFFFRVLLFPTSPGHGFQCLFRASQVLETLERSALSQCFLVRFLPFPNFHLRFLWELNQLTYRVLFF